MSRAYRTLATLATQKKEAAHEKAPSSYRGAMLRDVYSALVKSTSDRQPALATLPELKEAAPWESEKS